jgi:hypothetical protein
MKKGEEPRESCISGKARQGKIKSESKWDIQRRRERNIPVTTTGGC